MFSSRSQCQLVLNIVDATLGWATQLLTALDIRLSSLVCGVQQDSDLIRLTVDIVGTVQRHSRNSFALLKAVP